MKTITKKSIRKLDILQKLLIILFMVMPWMELSLNIFAKEEWSFGELEISDRFDFEDIEYISLAEDPETEKKRREFNLYLLNNTCFTSRPIDFKGYNVQIKKQQSLYQPKRYLMDCSLIC